MRQWVRRTVLALAWAVPIAATIFQKEIHDWLGAHGMSAILGAWPFFRAVIVALPYAAVVWLYLSHRALRAQLANLPMPPDFSGVTTLVELRATEIRKTVEQDGRIAAQEIGWIKERLEKLEQGGKKNAKT